MNMKNMKKMKKIISAFLSVTMLLQMGVSVLANEGTAFATSTVLKDAKGNNINWISDIEIKKVGAKTVLYATKKASATDTGVFAFDITDIKNPILIDSKSMENVNAKTRVELFDFNGKSFLVASGSSTCTKIWRINSDGTLEDNVAASGIYLTWSNDMASAGNTVVIVTDQINGHTPMANSSYEAYQESTCMFNPAADYSYLVEFTNTTYTVPADYKSCSITAVGARQIGGDIYIATAVSGILKAGALVEGTPADADSATTEHFIEIRKKKMLNRWNNDKAFYFELVSREKVDVGLESLKFVDDNTLVSSYYSGSWDSETVGLYKTEIDLNAALATDVIEVIPVVTQTSGLAVLPLSDGNVAVGARNDLGYLDIYDGKTDERIYRYTYTDNRPTSLAEFDGNIYSTTEDGQLYVNYRASMEITSKGGKLTEPEYNLKATFKGLPTGSVVKMKVGDNESIDVTSEIVAGKLEKTVSVENGEYEIVLQVLDGANVVLEDSVAINVDAKPQVSFKNISVNGDTVSFDVKNEYSKKLDNCIIVALSYSDASMVAKGKLELADFSGSLTDKSISLDSTIGANTVLLAISSISEPKLVSEIMYVSGNTSSFDKATVEGAVSRINGKPNALQELDPVTNRLTTAIANDTEKECDAVIFVFNDSAKVWDNVAFAYAGKTDAKGYKTIEYTINDNPSEGDVYYTTVATGRLNSWKINSDVTKSYWGIDTVNQALAAIAGANEETIGTILTTHPCSSVLRLDFSGEYSKIGEFYQKNVLSAMAGKTFSTSGEAVDKFNALIEDQKIVKIINESKDDALVNNLTLNSGAIGVNLAGLYDELLPEQKDEVFDTYMTGKGFSYFEDIKEAFDLGVAMTFIKAASYTKIIDDTIIEKYYADLGISEAYKTAYENASNKSDIIRTFMLKTITVFDDIATMFEQSCDNPQSFGEGSGGTGGGSGSGGGVGVSGKGDGGASVPPVIDKSEIDPTQTPKDYDDEIIFDDVKNNQWYYEAIYNMAKKGYVNGVTEDSFAPDNKIKREEFIKIIVSAFSLYDDFAETEFKDTNDNRWHYKYIASAESAGIIKGNGTGNFGVGEFITREDMAVILARVITLKGIELDNLTGEVQFADNNMISSYAVESVKMMSSAGIINGYPNNTFGAKGNATRAQAAQMVWNIIK